MSDVPVISAENLNVKIFADGADLTTIRKLAGNRMIKGFTTNPTLMRQAGVTDYLDFAERAVEAIGSLPISLEVFSDELREMKRQALRLAQLAPSVFVKIPVTNTSGESTSPLIRELVLSGVNVNVTAVFTIAQVEQVLPELGNGRAGYVSIFAGRVADTGRDPTSIIKAILQRMSQFPQLECIWASPREVLNIVQAHECKCHIITVTSDLLKKLPSLGKDLNTYSLETVQMFFNDAQAASYKL